MIRSRTIIFSTVWTKGKNWEKNCFLFFPFFFLILCLLIQLPHLYGIRSIQSYKILFTFLASSENFGGASPADISNGHPFIGTIASHMSSHSCVRGGLLPLGRYENLRAPRVNGACVLKNVYYTPKAKILNSDYAGVWTFVTSVPSDEVDRGMWGSNALRKVIWSLEMQLRVSLSSRNSYEGNVWPVSIAVYSAAPIRSSGVLRTNISRELNTLRMNIKERERNANFQSALVVQDCPQIMHRDVSDPPGVTKFYQNPFFLLPLTNLGNIGHALWDDVLSFFSISDDLGLTPRLHEFNLLLIRYPSSWFDTESILNSILELCRLSSPGRCPQEITNVDTILEGGIALFAEVAGGLTHASPHNLRPDMKGYGWQKRSLWKMRRIILDATGATNDHSVLIRRSHENNSSVDIDAPIYKLLFVRSKRSLRNEAEILSYLRREFRDIIVDDISWERLGGGAEGFRAEILRLSKTHILLSGDGTVSTTVPFLPAGSVHIQLGSNRPWGTQFKIDMLLSNLDHVRVLYYGGRITGEHDGDPLHDFEVPPQKLAPLIKEALKLLKDGFEIPVPPSINMVPSAKLLSNLISEFPDFAAFVHAGSITWEDLKVEPYAAQATFYYRKFVALGNSAAAQVFEQSAREFCEKHGCLP